MAETSIVIRRWITSIRPDGTENALTFDAVIRESHTSELSITDNPVETGVVLSDHACMQPLKLSMEGAFSNTPMEQRRYYGSTLVTSGKSAIINGDTIKAGADNGLPRSSNAWNILTTLQAAAVPFDVQTGLKLYKNMVILRLSCDQEKESVGALFFTADLRQVLFATSQAVKYPERAIKKAQPKKKQVEKKADPPTVQEAAKANKSMLYQGIEWAGFIK